MVLFSQEASQNVQENRDIETEEFDFANGLFSRGMYDMAVEAYGDFSKKYSESVYLESAFYRMAEGAFMAGKYNDALDKFDFFLGKYPSSKFFKRGLLREGQIYYIKADYDKAIEILSNLTSGENENGEISEGAKYYLASSYFRKNNFLEAKYILEELIAGEKTTEYTPFIHMNIGDIYSALGSHIQAAQAYAKAEESIAGTDKKVAAQAAFRAALAYSLAEDYENAGIFYGKTVNNGSEDTDIFKRSVIGILSSLYKCGNYEEAEKQAVGLLDRVKEPALKAEILFITGNGYFSRDNFAEAKKNYEKAWKKYPNTPFGIKSKLNECWALYKMGEYDKCLANTEKYIEKMKEQKDEALYIKAEALRAMKKIESGLFVYKNIIENYKDSEFRKEAVYEIGWVLDTAGEFSEALEYYEMFMKEYPEEERYPEALLKTAQLYLELKKYEDAEKRYNDFLSAFTDNALRENALYQLGGMYFELEEYVKAIEIYRIFLKEFPDSTVKASALYLTGGAYQKEQKWDEAIGIFFGLSAEKNGEFYERSAESLGYCFFKKGDHKKAAEIYYSLIASPSVKIDLPKEVYRWTADFYLNNNQSEKSLEILNILMKRFPDADAEGEISYSFAENYGNIAEWEKAVEFFDTAIGKKVPPPYLTRAYLGLGKAYRVLGAYEKAITILNKVLENSSDNMMGAFARMEIGNVKLKESDFAEAAKQYMMVGILYEDNDLCPMALYHAGISFGRAGSKEKSLEAFNQLIKKYPQNELSVKAKEEIKKYE